MTVIIHNQLNVLLELMGKFEKKYNAELKEGNISKGTKFEYAWCLIRSKYTDDIKKGIVLLEDLLPKGTKEEQRDYVFYLAVANYRLKEYEKALKYIRGLLKTEPGNTQALELEKLINKAMQKGGFVRAKLFICMRKKPSVEAKKEAKRNLFINKLYLFMETLFL
uniref:Mitochondrial fission 1 protein n=1 Tax=Anolis carolinensis TaxID=28377 RepID=H9GPE8_ANOCA